MEELKPKIIIDWCDGLKKNSKELLLNKMWEESYGENSTFFQYYLDPPRGKYSTLKYYLGGKIIGVLVFPHFPLEVRKINPKYNEEKELKELTGKNEIKYCSIGEVQLYVKPEHRGNGIAKKMILEFEKDLTLVVNQVKELDGSQVIPILQSVEKAFDLVSKYLPNYLHIDIYGYEPRSLSSVLYNEWGHERMMSYLRENAA